MSQKIFNKIAVYDNLERILNFSSFRNMKYINSAMHSLALQSVEPKIFKCTFSIISIKRAH